AQISTTGYTIYGYAWLNREYQGMTTYSISATTSGDISGALSGVSVTTVDTGVLVKNRKNTELLVTFTITTALPETGSILIKFPTGVTPDPHCRSAQSANSKLADGTGV